MNPKRPQNHLTTVGLIICLLLFLNLGGCGSKSDGSKRRASADNAAQ